jgi:methyltransferase-like protein
MECIFALNPVGEYIWQQLDGTRTTDEILDRIISSFDVTRDEAKADMQEFIGRLCDAQLLEE